MLKTEDINSIAAMLKMDAADFLAKYQSDKEEEITLPTLSVFTETELAARLKNEKATSYGEGQQAREEMLVKDARKELNYPNDGSLKTFADFMEHHNEQLKTKYSKDSTSRVSELESDIEKLNSAHTAALSAATQEAEAARTSLRKQTTTNQLLSMMPNNTTIDPSDIITLFNSNYDIATEDGKTIIKKAGETLKDETTANPLGLKDVFDAFVAEKKYSAGTKGRGGRNEYGDDSDPKTMDEFHANWAKSGKQTIGSEYDNAYAAARAAQTATA